MFHSRCISRRNLLHLILFWLVIIILQPGTEATSRYYNSYISYGTGDTIIQAYHQHMGTANVYKKWNIECLDGEAMVGIGDWTDDFERIQHFWCRFTFGFKPAANLYPYYGGCHIRNYTNQYFCYNPQNAAKTINTFVVATWSSSFQWFVHTPVAFDNSPYKCCQPPAGYYIDYTSCYFQVTHDPYFEYYDNTNFFIVACATSYVMTGIAKKLNPYDKEYHMEWIQCCRMGFGPHTAQPPPLTTNPADGSYSLYSPRSIAPPHSQITEGYKNQYRTVRSAFGEEEDEYFVNKTLGVVGESGPDADTVAYVRRKAGKKKRKGTSGPAVTTEYDSLLLEALDRPLVKFSTAGKSHASY